MDRSMTVISSVTNMRRFAKKLMTKKIAKATKQIVRNADVNKIRRYKNGCVSISKSLNNLIFTDFITSYSASSLVANQD